MSDDGGEMLVTSDDDSDADTDYRTTPISGAANIDNDSENDRGGDKHPKPHPPASKSQLDRLLPLPSSLSLSLTPAPSLDRRAGWVAVTEDGAVLQYDIRTGGNDGGDTVELLSHVYLHLTGTTSSGTTFVTDHWGDNELDAVLGQATLPKGLEIALCSMTVGQHCIVAIDGSSDYGYSATRCPDPLKNKKEHLYFEMKVRRYEREKNLHQMTFTEKMEFVRKRRIVGKGLFEHNEPRSALRQYEKALTVLETVNRDPKYSVADSVAIQAMKKNAVSHTQSDGDSGGEVSALMLVMLMNCAQCKSKVSDWIGVLTLCNQLLTIEPNHRKALHRRATAHYHREEWAEAKTDFQQLLSLSEADIDTNEEALSAAVIAQIKRQLAVIEQQQQVQRQAEKKKWNGFLLANTSTISSSRSSNTSSSSTTRSSNKSGGMKVSLYDDVVVVSEPATTSTLSGNPLYSMFAHVRSFATFVYHQTRQLCRKYNQPRPQASNGHDGKED